MQGAQGVKPYRTIGAYAETELLIQKSRFIGRCYPVSGEAQAAEILEGIRKRYWDASHNCYAFRIGAGGMLSRSSDDGEPSGTAGAPILGVLTRAEITNTLCVVTRYFGGILLGAGGLVRAYSGAASGALQLAGVLDMRSCTCLSVTLSYAQYATMEKSLRDCGDIENIAYTDVVTVKLWVTDERKERVTARLLDASDGRAGIAETESAMRPTGDAVSQRAGENDLR